MKLIVNYINVHVFLLDVYVTGNIYDRTSHTIALNIYHLQKHWNENRISEKYLFCFIVQHFSHLEILLGDATKTRRQYYMFSFENNHAYTYCSWI